MNFSASTYGGVGRIHVQRCGVDRVCQKPSRAFESAGNVDLSRSGILLEHFERDRVEIETPRAIEHVGENSREPSTTILGDESEPADLSTTSSNAENGGGNDIVAVVPNR